VWTGAALIVTVLMGGLIAYLGDLIGRRFGRRRASLFGLRPRHTAALITSVTGVMISLLTTLVLFIAVKPVRQVILQGEAAIRSSARLRQENTALLESNRHERELVARSRQERQEAVRQRDIAVNEQRKAEQNLTVARRQLQQATEAVQRAHRELQVAQRAARLAHAQVLQERRAAQELARNNETLRTTNEELRRLSDELKQRNESLRTENASLAATNQTYSQENEAVSRQNEALVRERDSLTSVVTDLRAQQVKLEDQVRSLQTQYNELAQSYTTAYGAHRSLWEMFEGLRTQRIAVHGGEELARCVIPPDTPPEGVRQAIGSLLSDAHREALKKGAAPGEKARAVEIVDRRFATPTPTGVTTLRVTEQERVDAVVSRLARSSEPACLLAVAVANSIVGEPSAIDLQPLANPLVYRKGQVVATRKLDAARAPGEVFEDLVLMLRGLGQSALSRGMIPRMDPLTGEPEVGSLSAKELVDLTFRVRSVHKRVEVTALAADDMNASDTLALDFRVKPSL